MNIPNQWDLSPREAVEVQQQLAGRIRLQPLPMDFDVLGAADIGYVPSANLMVAVIVTFQWPDLTLLEAVHEVSPVQFPYIPGLLSFREVPPLLETYKKLKHPPKVLLCDGQGIAHPREFGLASHLGLCLEIPTIGCAKKRLCGLHEPLPLKRGLHTPLLLKGKTVGCVYCSRDGVKPIYISPGHLSDIDSAKDLVGRSLGRYRLPEPLRQAHHLATQLRRNLLP